MFCGSIPRPADDEKIAGCAGSLTNIQIPEKFRGKIIFFQARAGRNRARVFPKKNRRHHDSFTKKQQKTRQ
jgi:hypothetical protein